MSTLRITELLDVNIMQQLQDGFSRYTGMASIMADETGAPVTNPSRFTRFCNDLVRQTPIGCSRCESCDRSGAVITLRSGKASTYNCHAGLVDFAAPIMVEGKFIGSFIGGQVRVAEIDEEQMRRDALEFGLDPEEYVEEAGKVPMLPRERVDAAADFLFELARIISEMAYNNYYALEMSRKQEQSAKAQTDVVMKVCNELRESIIRWREAARVSSDVPEYMKETLKMIRSEGTNAIGAIEDTLEFIRISDGKVELTESEYNIRDLLEEMVASSQELVKDKPIRIEFSVDADVPAYVLGDAGHLMQILYKLMLNSITYSDEGVIDISVSSYRVSYAAWLKFVVKDHGRGIRPDVLEELQRDFGRNLTTELQKANTSEIGLSMIGLLVRQMHGVITVDSEWGKGSEFVIRIPQLDLGGEMTYGI